MEKNENISVNIGIKKGFFVFFKSHVLKMHVKLITPQSSLVINQFLESYHSAPVSPRWHKHNRPSPDKIHSAPSVHEKFKLFKCQQCEKNHTQSNFRIYHI